MLQKIVGKIWRIIPAFLRLWLVRTTQTKFTVSVGAIVINNEDKILLLDHVLRPAAGWGIPGGFIDADESPVQAIRRELREEIGLEIENIEMLHFKTTKRHIEILLSAQTAHAGKVQSFEIKQLGWFDYENMPQSLSTVHKQIIKEVLSKTVKC
jgi:ADP-ribose pyrophosphatase YjhB (NUDIX family)